MGIIYQPVLTRDPPQGYGLGRVRVAGETGSRGLKNPRGFFEGSGIFEAEVMGTKTLHNDSH